VRRKSPVRHTVSRHIRNGKQVSSYRRGEGHPRRKFKTVGRVIKSSLSIGKQIGDAQDLWLEHYAFGKPRGDPDRYSVRPENRERARIQEHAMDAVREMRKDWRGWGYIEEKLGRIHDNYLGTYDEYPSDWYNFKKLSRYDREIFAKLVQLEKEKVRPLYKKLKNREQRDAITATMDFVVMVSDPTVTLDELWKQYHHLRWKVNLLLRKDREGRYIEPEELPTLTIRGGQIYDGG